MSVRSVEIIVQSLDFAQSAPVEYFAPAIGGSISIYWLCLPSNTPSALLNIAVILSGNTARSSLDGSCKSYSDNHIASGTSPRFDSTSASVNHPCGCIVSL